MFLEHHGAHGGVRTQTQHGQQTSLRLARECHPMPAGIEHANCPEHPAFAHRSPRAREYLFTSGGLRGRSAGDVRRSTLVAHLVWHTPESAREETPPMSLDTSPDSSTRPSGTSTLEKIARACVRHRWIVIGAWVAALVVINGIAGAVGPDYRTDFTLPASETKEVQELLEANSPDRAGFTAPDRVPRPARGRRSRGAGDDERVVRLRGGSRRHHRHLPVRLPAADQRRTARSPSPGSTSPTPARSPN